MNDDAIFGETVRTTASYIYSLSYRLTGSADDAADLAQETYLKAFERRTQLRDPQKALPWLRRICLRAFIDDARKRGARRGMRTVRFPDGHELASTLPTPEQEMMGGDDVARIRSQCFSILSSSLCLYQRIAFVLIDVFGLDAGEVALLTGKSVPSVKSALHRARGTMYRKLASACGIVQEDAVCSCGAWIAFAHDIGKKRALLKEMLAAGADPHPPGAAVRKRLGDLFKALPYLEPPRVNSGKFAAPEKKSAP